MSDSSDVLGSQTLQRYRVLEELGRGGFGVVFEAEQKTTGQRVAIKQMRERPFADAQQTSEMRKRFLREMQLISRLSSPHVVRLVDADIDDDGRPFMILEFVEGRTLTQHLARVGPLDARTVRRMAQQVLEALAEAHALGIVHRDLKPENIMLAGEAPYLNAKVLDFGIAGIQADFKAESDTTITEEGQVRGTPAYMAPEQFQLFAAPNPQSDVYAVGLILVECITGQMPGEGTPMLELFHKRSKADLVLPDGIADHPLGAVIRRATRVDPAARYANGREMLEALTGHVADPLATGRNAVVDDRKPQATLSPTADIERRTVGLSGGTPPPSGEAEPSAPDLDAPIDAFAATSAELGSDAFTRDPEGSDPADAPSRRRSSWVLAVVVAVVVCLVVWILVRDDGTSAGGGAATVGAEPVDDEPIDEPREPPSANVPPGEESVGVDGAAPEEPATAEPEPSTPVPAEPVDGTATAATDAGDELLRGAMAAAARDEHERAVTLLAAYLELRPDDRNGLEVLVRSLVALERWDDAAPHLDALDSDDTPEPLREFVVIHRASALLERGKRRKGKLALADYRSRYGDDGVYADVRRELLRSHRPRRNDRKPPDDDGDRPETPKNDDGRIKAPERNID